MVEVINTSTKVIDLEKNDIFVEISTVETESKLEIELYAFREHPEKDRMLLVKFVGDHTQKQNFLSDIYYILKDPEEWMRRYGNFDE